MAKPRKRPTKPPEEKKYCVNCEKEKGVSYFFKVEKSAMFPDERLNICRDCVRSTVDVNDVDQVIGFLRQIDKPYIERIWNESLNSNRHPIGSYMGKINSLHHLTGLTFNDSDGVRDTGSLGTVNDVMESKLPDRIETEQGDELEYSDDLIAKWGLGYKKHEYLQLEKFYQDMIATHEIYTPIHKDMLVQLAKLSVKRNKLLEDGDIGNYDKAIKAYETMMKSAGFRPVDRKGTDEQTGLRSFSQIFEEIEKRGHVKPPPPVFEEDIVDAMIISLANYYHRIVGKEILTEVPDELKEQYTDYLDNEYSEDDL